MMKGECRVKLIIALRGGVGRGHFLFRLATARHANGFSYLKLGLQTIYCAWVEKLPW